MTMAQFTAASNGGYQGAMQLIGALKRAGIEAGITTGGVWVSITPDQVPLAEKACKDNNGKLICGPTDHQSEILAQSPDGWEVLKKATNDAIAVKKEWT
jgi:hypothetical protein